MSVIATFAIPAEDFILGKALQEVDGITVELEQMIPIGEATIPYFWVIGEEKDRFDEILRDEPELTDFEVIDTVNDRQLYRAEWDSSIDSFVQTMVSFGVVLQEAGGDAESWTFQLRFSDSQQLSEFHAACRERGITLSVESIYNPIESASVETREMTDAQRALIKRAFEEGYFDIPRGITLAEIADELGISDQAVNERLRRGLSTLIAATIMTETGPETDD